MPRITIISDRARSLLSEDLFDRLCRRITIEDGTDRAFAERIMDQALAFLAACGRFPDNKPAPSKPVDIGWHTFVLYTHEYAEFCERVAGRFIHHVPQDAPQHPKDPSSVRDTTVDAIRRAGYVVDAELWIADAYSCGSCHEDGNCAASGKDGNENTDTRTI